ncbi:MAG: glycosyltransferase family 2 protein [Lachnospiraceae bacterium]|nr:glycosyltransferase family 2 protein [Lachnospiraceae bacterium]
MKPTPLLSICIPTYNRANRAASCVKACLELPYEDLEVVCLDNCSTDDTEQKLAQIRDERFVYRRNSENIGYPNIVEVMRHASGEYALLLSDEDRINPRFVADALELLKTEKKAAIIWFALTTDRRKRDKRYKSASVDGLQFILCNTYMSGICIRTKNVSELYDRIPKSGSFYKMYPHTLLMSAIYDSGAEMLVCGTVKRMTIREGKVNKRDKRAVQVFRQKGNAYNVLGRFELADAGITEIPQAIGHDSDQIRKTVVYSIFTFPVRCLFTKRPVGKEIVPYAAEHIRYWYYGSKLRFRLIQRKLLRGENK